MASDDPPIDETETTERAGSIEMTASAAPTYSLTDQAAWRYGTVTMKTRMTKAPHRSPI
jgi:hypothetical protein